MASQLEVLELVLSAIDRATPVMEIVSKSLDLVKVDITELGSVMKESAESLRHTSTAMKDTGGVVRDFHKQVRESAPAFTGARVEIERLAGTMASNLVGAVTKIGGALYAAYLTVTAFHKKLVDAKTTNELARSLGMFPEMIIGMRSAGDAIELTGEKVDSIVTGFGKTFQNMRFEKKGDVYDKMRQVEEAKELRIEMVDLAGQVERNEISSEEGQKRAMVAAHKFVRDYEKVYDHASMRIVLERMGFDPDFANFGKLTPKQFKDKIDGLGQVRLDPAQVERFWKAWRDIAKTFKEVTTSVLGPMLPLLNLFMEKLINNKHLKEFAEFIFAEYTRIMKAAYLSLKKMIESDPIDWAKALGKDVLEFLKNDFINFINQTKREFLRIRAGLGFGSQKDVNEARKEELTFRKESVGPLTEKEEMELKGLEEGTFDVPLYGLPQRKWEPATEKAIRDALEKRRQKPLQFTDAVTDEALRIEVENTRALKDLNDEIKKLNDKLLRATGRGGDTEVIEGRAHGGPVHPGSKYWVGELAPELFVPRQEGGEVQPVGEGGPQLFSPGQSGDVYAMHTPPSQQMGGEPPLVGSLPDPYANLPKRPPTLPEIRGGTAVAPAGSYSGVFAGETLTKLPSKSPYKGSDSNLGGVTEGIGVASTFGTLPEAEKAGRKSGLYYDITKGPGGDTPGSARIRDQFPGIKQTSGKPGFPEEYQGIALGNRETLGKWFDVTMPDGRTFTWQQTDTGPNMALPSSARKPIDLSAGALSEAGFKGPKDFSEGIVKFAPADPEIARQKDRERLDQLRAGGHITEELYNQKRLKQLAGEEDFPRLAARQEGGSVIPPEDEASRSLSRMYKQFQPQRDRWMDFPSSKNIEDRSSRPPYKGPEYTFADRLLETDDYWQKQVRANERAYGGSQTGKDLGIESIGRGISSTRDMWGRESGPEDQKQKGNVPQSLHSPGALVPGSLNIIQQQSEPQGYEATGSLNVNVRGPRGTSVKAEGTGPFETVNVTRQMTNGEPRLGTG